MATDDNVLRTKILIEINEDFHDGGKTDTAIDTDGFLTEIIKCFEEQDVTIRELASRAIIKVASTEKGRDILVSDDLVTKIRELFDDKVVAIRANAYKAVISIAEFTFGIDAAINCNIIPVLVDNLVEEKDRNI